MQTDPGPHVPFHRGGGRGGNIYRYAYIIVCKLSQGRRRRKDVPFHGGGGGGTYGGRRRKDVPFQRGGRGETYIVKDVPFHGGARRGATIYTLCPGALASCCCLSFM